VTLPSPEPPPRVVAASLFFGWLLLALGDLMVLLCGGCTLTFLVGLSGGRIGSGDVLMILISVVFVGLIGGVPTACGGLLVWTGWRILHPAGRR